VEANTQDSPRTVELNQNSSSLDNTGYSNGYYSPKQVTSNGYDGPQGDSGRITHSFKQLSTEEVNKRIHDRKASSSRSLICPPNKGCTRKSMFNIPRSSTSLHTSFSSCSWLESEKVEAKNDSKVVVTYDGSEEINHVLYNHFQQFGYDVKVEPMENNPFGYVIIFRSAKIAEDALKKKHIFDYKLEKYTSVKIVKEQGVALPTQNEPLLYKILNRTTVRKGIKKTSEVVCDLYKGELVSVDKLVNNRARVVEINRKGVCEVFGWVSVRTDCGVQLLITFKF